MTDVVPRRRAAAQTPDEPGEDWTGRPLADLHAEQVVLGLMMSSSRQVEDATDVLRGSDFYWPKHEAIWGAVLAVWASGDPVNPLAVSHALAQADDLNRVGGAPYLHTLTAAVPTAAGTVGYYAQIVYDWSRRRQVHEAGMRIAQSARTLANAVDDVVERAQKDIHAATAARLAADPVVVGDFIDDEFSHLEDIRDGKVPAGISTGFADLDRVVGGWQPGRLIIPAGRPGAGKSLLTLNAASEALRRGYPVLIFPMEMSKREVMWRMWSDWARIPLHLFEKARFSPQEWDRLRAVKEDIRKLPLIVDDQVNTVAQIRSTSRRAAQQHGTPGLIIADYVQRLSFPGKERRDIEVGDAAKAFKELSKELKTTFIAVCQINRGNEARADKLPQLSDLRDSGQLEQEADQVILIHRPDYYDKEHVRAGEADLIVAKNRHGPTDTVTVAAQLHFARFKDMNNL